MLRRAIKRQQNKTGNVDYDKAKPTKVKKSSGKALGEIPRKGSHEKVLEKLVLGAEDELIESLEKKSEAKVRVFNFTFLVITTISSYFKKLSLYRNH